MKIGWMFFINELQETCGRQVIKLFLCGNPSVHCIQTSNPKVKGSTPVRSSWIFSEYAHSDHWKINVSFLSFSRVKAFHLIYFFNLIIIIIIILLSLLIFHNHFFRREEAQEELQKAKLMISLFSSSLSVLTERVVWDGVSHRGALPGSPNWVVSSRPQATSTPVWQP